MIQLWEGVGRGREEEWTGGGGKTWTEKEACDLPAVKPFVKSAFNLQ